MKDIELLKLLIDDDLKFYNTLSYKEKDEFVKGAIYTLNNIKKNILKIEENKEVKHDS